MLAWMWGKRYTFTLLVELQIGATTPASSVQNPQKTWNGPTGPTFDPLIPLLSLYPKDLKLAYYSNAATSMFTAAQFTIARLWNQPRCPSVDEWKKKIYTQWNITQP